MDQIIKMPAWQGAEQLNIRNVGSRLWQDASGVHILPPKWVADLILVEANICRVSEEGSFAAGIPLLEHLQKTGINALWVTPFFENRGNANRTSHYGNHGPHTLADDSFRAKDHLGRVQELQAFVAEAHRRGIYVFADVVTYGVLGDSPIYQAYLSNTEFEGIDVSGWFNGERLYSGYRFLWQSESLRKWFTDRMVDLIRTYDLDGFRVDSEPGYLWYDSDGDGIADRYADLFSDVRMRVAGYEQDACGNWYYPADGHGREITVFSEKNNLRNFGYDFEQYGVIHYGKEHILRFQIREESRTDWFFNEDLAKAVKSGHLADGCGFREPSHLQQDIVNRFPYYTYCLSNHDNDSVAVQKRLWVIGYQAILAPFLPVWFVGEECGLATDVGTWLNAIPVDPDALLLDPENAAFYAQIRQLIAIRRGYPELFGLHPQDIRYSNIDTISVDGGCMGNLRYSGTRLSLILANPGKEAQSCNARFDAAHLPKGAMTVRDLLSGREYACSTDGKAAWVEKIAIPAGGMAVLLAEAR